MPSNSEQAPVAEHRMEEDEDLQEEEEEEESSSLVRPEKKKKNAHQNHNEQHHQHQNYNEQYHHHHHHHDNDDNKNNNDHQREQVHLTDLVYSEFPQYSKVFIVLVLVATLALCAFMTLTVYALFHERLPPALLVSLSVLCNCAVVLHVLCRMPVRYQIWRERVTVATIESYVLPFRVFSRRYSVALSNVQHVEQLDNRDCALAAPEFVASVLPNTFVSLAWLWGGSGKFVRIVVHEDQFWMNFVLTASTQFYRQLKRAKHDLDEEVVLEAAHQENSAHPTIVAAVELLEEEEQRAVAISATASLPNTAAAAATPRNDDASVGTPPPPPPHDATVAPNSAVPPPNNNTAAQGASVSLSQPLATAAAAAAAARHDPVPMGP